MSMIEEISKLEDRIDALNCDYLSQLHTSSVYTLDRVLYYRYPFKGETITIDEYNNPNTIKSYYKPLETFMDGSLVLENSTGRMFIFGNDNYIEAYDHQDTKDNDKDVISASIDTHRDIVVSDCPKCASNLPIREVDDKGICTCKFCGKDVYVWAKGE